MRRWVLLLLLFVVAACRPAEDSPTLTETVVPPSTGSSAPTDVVSPLPPGGEAVITVTARITTLVPPLDRKKVELSGLAWHGDDLILLPQYPHQEGDHLYLLPRAAVEAFAEEGEALPAATPLPFRDDDLHKLSGFEGFEAIAFEGDDCYLTIEAHDGEMMVAYVVSGHWEEGGITLKGETLHPIYPQINLPNMSDEALLIAEGKVFTFDEANGPEINPQPLAHCFDARTLEPLSPLPFPPLDYRITDATAPDAEGCFWVVDYLWPGDAEKLRPVGPADEPVEQLIPLRLEEKGFVPCTERPIVALKVAEDGKARNWEGVVRLEEEGFLLVTDTHPETLFAFVPAAP